MPKQYPERLTVMLAEGQLARIDEAAFQDRITRQEWLRQLIGERLRQDDLELAIVTLTNSIEHMRQEGES
ncbi:MAG: hypothetical protein OXL33_01940 [Chloroflexota bacterium]|nr:hypothetical protein [Chloroflexota bacterium]